MKPLLHLKKEGASSPYAEIRLPVDSAGGPIYPGLGEIVEYEGLAYVVAMIFWNLEQRTIDVCAEEVTIEDQTKLLNL